MEDKKNYFHIEEKDLPKGIIIFPFHLFIQNPHNKQYSKYLFANSPFDDEKKLEVSRSIDKGAKLAISLGQKNTFLKATGLKEEDIPDLNSIKISTMVTQREEIIKKTEKKVNTGNDDFILKKELRVAIEDDNFLKLIERVKEEIGQFPVTLSPTVSLARELVEKNLTEDNETTRIVVLSYFTAKIIGFKSELDLADLICASFLHHIGLGQFGPYYTKTPLIRLSGKHKEKYYKHSNLSVHLLKKIGLDLTPKCLRIIQEHHERADGSGFPFELTINKIDPLSLVLGAISHIVEYSVGRISGNKTPIKTVFMHLKNKSMPSGLQFEFGTIIYNNLVTFVDTVSNNIAQEKS